MTRKAALSTVATSLSSIEKPRSPGDDDLTSRKAAAESDKLSSDIEHGETGVVVEHLPPRYLTEHYWWAYEHPRAVSVFERQWLTNAILWGNYPRLRDLALNELGDALPGRTLQVACAYGDFTPRLLERIADGGRLDVIDALQIQIDNLRAKLPRRARLNSRLMDSARMDFPDCAFDRAVLFFLLHEQPADVRRRTIAETLRVVKPGGRIVIIDYARPYRFNPLHLLMRAVLTRLEPFAPDLWNEDIAVWTPEPWAARMGAPQRYFGGLYQMIALTR